MRFGEYRSTLCKNQLFGCASFLWASRTRWANIVQVEACNASAVSNQKVMSREHVTVMERAWNTMATSAFTRNLGNYVHSPCMVLSREISTLFSSGQKSSSSRSSSVPLGTPQPRATMLRTCQKPVSRPL